MAMLDGTLAASQDTKLASAKPASDLVESETLGSTVTDDSVDKVDRIQRLKNEMFCSGKRMLVSYFDS